MCLTWNRLLHAFEVSSERFGGEFSLISHLKSAQKSSQYYAGLTSKARRTQQGERTAKTMMIILDNECLYIYQLGNGHKKRDFAKSQPLLTLNLIL